MTDFDWMANYRQLNSTYSTRPKRPLIGITGNYDKETCTLAEGYYQSVISAGGIPVVIPPNDDFQRLAQLLDTLDGIIFSGGGDINPLLIGEQPVKELHSICPERDMQELLLARLAYDRQIPMLGICKGIQVINAALGGTLYQDIHSQMDGVRIKHSQDLDRRYSSHTVSPPTPKGGGHADEYILWKIFKQNTANGNTSSEGLPSAWTPPLGDGGLLPVNSFHHQACKAPAPCLKVSAVSTDGVIEAIESNEHKSILGVQWHPETYILRGSKEMMPIFNWLIGEADEFARAKALHQRILTLDSHCDTPMFFPQGIDFASRDDKILVDLHKMQEGHLDASIMVAYLEQQERDEASLLNATAKANQILSKIEEMVAMNCTAVDIARTPDDAMRLKAEGKRAIFMGIENGYAFGTDLSNVEAFRKRGVVYTTLCHNGDNDICGSHKAKAGLLCNNEGAEKGWQPTGVTDFGAKVIREMNRVGMMVDLSHASEQSFYDAIDISAHPIVCSHSSARALCDHTRNLTDDQMRRLAHSGGVAQVTFYSGFLRKDGQASILDAIDHLNHMVNVMGIEHVGIGTDFDGDGGVPGIASASELINFTRRLLRERYSEKDIEMIWGGNFLRVMREVQKADPLPASPRGGVG